MAERGQKVLSQISLSSPSDGGSSEDQQRKREGGRERERGGKEGGGGEGGVSRYIHLKYSEIDQIWQTVK